ncbi:hypothetical protein GBG21_01545 [Aeribacillus pallidus]
MKSLIFAVTRMQSYCQAANNIRASDTLPYSISLAALISLLYPERT